MMIIIINIIVHVHFFSTRDVISFQNTMIIERSAAKFDIKPDSM